MSIAMPTQDIAPSVPTRLVTMKFGTMWKGPNAKGVVTFTLPGDLRIPADDVTLQAGAWDVVLDASGQGSIPLPTYDTDAIGDGVGNEWFILVSKSWTKQVDMIRVPAGTTPISLSDISPVVDVTPAMGQWLLTGAGVEIVEGAQWGATVAVAGGIAKFRFTVPPGGEAFAKGNVAANVNVNDLQLPGQYSIDAATAPTIVNAPAEVKGQPATVTVERIGTGSSALVFQQWDVGAFAVGQPPRRFLQQVASSFVSSWFETVIDGGMVPLGDRKSLLKQASRTRCGGRVGTAGAMPIALSFDHGFAKFRDLILPELRRLGLPATIAVCVDDLGSGENAGVDLALLQTWAINYGLEIANHGRSHLNQLNQSFLRNAILGSSLDVLRAGMPKLVVDTWIQPGVTGTDTWMGFSDGSELRKWWEHAAGRWILDNHAVATGVLGGRLHPVLGEPLQGIRRVGFDTTAWADTVTTDIQNAVGSGQGMHIYCHPNLVDAANQITLARVRQMLEFLAAERDAGRVEVLTVSGYAWSDPDSALRPDLARLAGGFVNGTVTVNVSEVAPWARGGQFLIEAEGAGQVSIQASDSTGALSASVTTADRPRLAITVPVDATTITITIPSTATARIRAV